METVTIDVVVRERSGKGVARKLRQSNRVPAVLNYKGSSLAIDAAKPPVLKLINSHQSGHTLVSLNMTGGARLAIVSEYQVHPYTRELLHVDFREVKSDEKVIIHVPVVLQGTASAVKMLGATMRVITRSVDLECLPKDIVNEVAFDVAEVAVGKSIHASDLPLPAGVALKSPPGTVIFSISAGEAEAPSAAAGAAAAPAAKA